MPASIFDRANSAFVRVFRDRMRLGETGDTKEIDFTGDAKLIFRDDDPTSVATDAPRGSILGRTGTLGGSVYRKLDDGSTTNWAILGADILDDPTIAENYSIDAAVAAGALTLSLRAKSGSNATPANKIRIAFRKTTLGDGGYDIREVTAALSTVISSGSTAGHADATDEFIYVYALDNAGTVELAWSTSVFDEGITHDTTAEGGAGAADDRHILYSTTARSGVAIRLLGRITSNQATAGTWAAAVTESSGPFVLPYNRFVSPALVFQSFTATTPTDATGFTGDIVTNTGKVRMYLIPSGVIANCDVRLENSGSSGTAGLVIGVRDGSTSIGACRVGASLTGPSSITFSYPPKTIFMEDEPGPGTHSYKIQVDLDTGLSGTPSIEFHNMKFVIEEVL